MGLKLITGLAGTGKTAAINEEINRAVQSGQGGRILIVPEQYSHEAERELCRVCGDSLSCYAEVLSFTGLARSLRAELGGNAVPLLDKGGKLLCMSLAVNTCLNRLTHFRKNAGRPEILGMLVSALDDLKTSCVTAEMLAAAAQKCSGELREKVSDLSVIYEAYNGVLGNAHADPADTLKLLAEQIRDSKRIGEDSVIYVDGFTDFTKAELEVLKELLRKHCTMTVCLTLDSTDGNSEVFAIQRSSLHALMKIAEELGISVQTESRGNDTSFFLQNPAHFLADNIFSYTDQVLDAQEKVELFTAGSAAEECRLAAAKVLELLRDCGYRRRDIAIAIRGFDTYAPILESIFEEYGIPLFTARKQSLSSRPLPLLISCAYDIINNGWKADDIIAYLGTGLSGISREESDLLSAYLFRWNLKTAAWHTKNDWTQHPEGFGKEYDDRTNELLSRINEIRRRISAPLLALEQRTKTDGKASELAKSLYEFLMDIRMPELLETRCLELAEAGMRYEAETYRQLWDVTIAAIDQMHAILSDLPMSAEAFASMFVRMLSTYDIGTIPLSLDCVSAGDFDRMRRRSIRALIVLGASSDRLPAVSSRETLFSDDELRMLEAFGTQIGEDPDNEMWREYSLIYSCLSLPSERLILSSPLLDSEGNETRPSFLLTRAEKLFGIRTVPYDAAFTSAAAEAPALRFALSGTGEDWWKIRTYLNRKYPGKLDTIRNSALLSRGKLSSAAVEQLYGKRPGISASRAEKFFSCRYGYFTQYGLKVRPFRQLDFSPSDLGTFTHYVLQHTAEDIKANGGFSSVSDSFVEESARKHIQGYETEILHDFSEKNPRFVYLFRRYAEDTVKIAAEMAHELRRSKFEPAAFEFDFSGFAPLPLDTGTGQASMKISGIADRIDIWNSGERTFLRIADYKTGNKKFSMAEIWYGMSMQLILYLYVLCSHSREAAEKLGLSASAALAPAGVMYVPASRRFLSSDRSDMSDEELQSEHRKNRKRSGIVLGSDGVPEAWETGPESVYSPLKFKDGVPVGDAAVTEEQFELLCSHMKKRLCEMADGLAAGTITADPFDNGGEDTACRYCDMKGKCGFTDGENGESYRRMISLHTSDVWEMIREEFNNG